MTTIPAARASADAGASPSGLHTGEVMQFSDNFYVELKDASGAAATEVMVDPRRGRQGSRRRRPVRDLRVWD